MKSSILTEDICALAQLPLWERVREKTLLITGATGMLGAYLALSALHANAERQLGCRVLLMCRDRAKAMRLFGERGTLLLQDVREPLTIDGPVHYALHTASPVGPTLFREQPSEVLSVNAEGTLSLLRGAQARGCEGFVLASTHEVYGQARGEVRENQLGPMDTMDSRMCYGQGKRAAENALACFCAQHGLRTVSARLSRLYGPLMNLSSGLFVADFINDVLHKRPVRVGGDGSLLRPLTYVRDAAAALLTLLVVGQGGSAYNVEGEDRYTIGEIAQAVAGLRDQSVAYARPQAPHKTPDGYWLCNEALQQLGWQAQMPLHDGLQRTITHFEEAQA